ncbi:hypothetical protein WJ96_04475 [Burkholderia ubonensis]|uniref:Uncharacterized protein n=1 Tax=Burkholderia ubonensis TaxID=101571 RepID=A0AAW3MSB1_9BURK|nr:hypothetical protein [Burkholderia ubonensis]KVP65628.1 hypothetical protein WJ93_24210 [Burkholderia ubonensis]KVP96486.1 hypothetical protein WJ97_11390 [Burkholderia ubonensis]KVP97831.1 hypothetical protein WJ96_04475 [Burkholderia ubonensis]KVZ92528.1 hypothetical protein WL25_16130 [Burkholderia ubonensis]
MSLQLQDYITAHGNELKIGHKVFTYLGMTAEGAGPDDIAIASVKSVRATYSAIRCNNARVIGRPGAETWAILSSNGRDIARFAVHDGQLLQLP